MLQSSWVVSLTWPFIFQVTADMQRSELGEELQASSTTPTLFIPMWEGDVWWWTKFIGFLFDRLKINFVGNKFRTWSKTVYNFISVMLSNSIIPFAKLNIPHCVFVIWSARPSSKKLKEWYSYERKDTFNWDIKGDELKG